MSPSNITELALEACIERHLTGGTSGVASVSGGEEASEVYQTSKGAGYLRGESSDFQRVKLVKIMEHVQKDPAYESQVVNNPDDQNREIALRSLITQAVNKERKKDLDLYKAYASDPGFKKAFDESIMRILSLHEKSKPAWERRR